MDRPILDNSVDIAIPNFNINAYGKFAKRYRHKPWKFLEEYYNYKIHWWDKVKLLWIGWLEWRKSPEYVVQKYVNKKAKFNFDE